MVKIPLVGLLFVFIFTNLKAQKILSLPGDSTQRPFLPPNFFSPLPNDSIKQSFTGKAKAFVKNNIHGMATVDYSYRDGNYPGQIIPKHLFRYRISPNVQVGPVPLNFNIGYASDYQGQLGKMYSLGFKLDYRKLQENLLKKAQEKLQANWVLNDSLLGRLQLALDTLPKLDSLKTLQSRINLDFDSLALTLPESPSVDSSALDSLNRLKEKIDSRISQIESLVNYRDKLLELRDGFYQKRAEIISRSKDVRNQDLSGINTRDRFLYSIKTLEIGSFSLNYGNYFAKGGQFFGAHTAFLIKGFQVISFGGSTKQNANFLRASGLQNTASQFGFIGGGFQLGKAENSIQILASTGRRKASGEESAAESRYTLYPDKNTVYSVLFTKKASRLTAFYGELAYSQFNRSELAQTTAKEVAAHTNRQDQMVDNSAGMLGFRGEAKFLDLNFDLALSQLGADYFSFANPYQRTDIRSIEAKLNKKFWRSRISWKGAAQIAVDNVSGKKSATTATNRYTNTFTTYFAKAPIIILSHTWVKLKTVVRESNYEIGYGVSVLALTITKTWSISEKVAVSNTGTWMNSTSFNRKTQTFQVNAINIQNALLFGKVSLQHAFGANHNGIMWGELSNQLAVIGAITKKLSAALSLGRINNQMYKTRRDQIKFKMGYQVLKNLNLEGSFECMKHKETGNSLSIGNLSAQFLW